MKRETIKKEVSWWRGKLSLTLIWVEFLGVRFGRGGVKLPPV